MLLTILNAENAARFKFVKFQISVIITRKTIIHSAQATIFTSENISADESQHALQENTFLTEKILSVNIFLKKSRFNFPESLKEKILDINFKSKILDFGCGNGKLLQNLQYFGFQNLTGADAFIEKNIFYPNGINIYKRPLNEIEPFFDLIMLHHSFEHLPDPLETLQEIYRLLAKNKFCLIRIPVVNYAWEKYGVNWVQLDPPRHLFLYTEKSLRLLAEKAGFTVEKVVYDSEEFQFWASEYYKRDIAMNDPNWFKLNFDESLFTENQFNEWKREAKKLNEEKKGDQACFYLRKT
jgi:SAM-dependent methyltransferase